MKRISWNWQVLAEVGRVSIATAVVATCALFSAPPAHAGDARLFVLAPQPPASLKTVETQGSDKPVYAHSYDIPYATVEQQIRKEVQNKGHVDLSDTVKCGTDLCPDVHWHVTVNSDFAFTQKSQPTLTPYGNAQENGIDVALDNTQFRLHADIHASLSSSLGSKSVDVPVDLVIAVKVKSKLQLWPDLKSIASYCEATKLQETACVELTLASSDINLSDVHGAVVAIGGALGGVIGASPLAGDPLSGLLVGIFVSDEAAKIAEQKVQAEASKALGIVMQIASIRATWLAGSYVDAKVTQIDNIKSKLLDTKLPGLNRSLADLAGAFGLSLDIQTKKSGGDIYVIVTPRFTANPAGAKLVGKLRMPKEACVYGEWKYGTLPLGLKTVDANRDLAGKIGRPCTEIMPSPEVKLNGYLGADPKILKVGADPLANWKPVGSLKLTGNLSEYKHGAALQTQMRQTGGSLRHKATGYYECGFEISGLPSADIIELILKGKTAERMAGFFQEPTRLVEVAAGGNSAALDDGWKQAGPPFVIGGEGKCTAGKLKVPHYEPESWLDRIGDLLDLDKCPNCDIKLSEGMLKAGNMKPVLENPALKPLFDALESGRALPAATQAPATQVPSTQQAPAGKQLAPAIRQQLQRPGAPKGTQK